MFLAKKEEIEIIINDHNPLCIGILEANVEHDIHPPALKIDGYMVELDGLHDKGLKGRTMVYVKEEANYIRRADLEPPLSPTIWHELFPGSKGAILVFFGYRQWCTLQATNKQRSRSTKQQLVRLSAWEESWVRAENEGKPLFILGDLNVDVQPWILPQTIKSLYQ